MGYSDYPSDAYVATTEPVLTSMVGPRTGTAVDGTIGMAVGGTTTTGSQRGFHPTSHARPTCAAHIRGARWPSGGCAPQALGDGIGTAHMGAPPVAHPGGAAHSDSRRLDTGNRARGARGCLPGRHRASPCASCSTPTRRPRSWNWKTRRRPGRGTRSRHALIRVESTARFTFSTPESAYRRGCAEQGQQESTTVARIGARRSIFPMALSKCFRSFV